MVSLMMMMMMIKANGQFRRSGYTYENDMFHFIQRHVEVLCMYEVLQDRLEIAK